MSDMKKNANEISLTIPLKITISVGSISERVASQLAASQLATRQSLVTTTGEAFSPVAQFSLAALNQTEFSWQAALACAMASKLSYSSADQVSAQCASWGFQSVRFLEAIDTQCFVAVGSDAVLLAFRGTENSADWLADFNALPTARPYGRIHRGFYHAFEDIRPMVEPILQPLQNRQLVVTGHSLGGALAAVASAEWIQSGTFQPSTVYTYGQPRVGFSAFKNFMDSQLGERYSRFVNDTDIVTRVPPGYAHVGKLYHFSSSGQLEESLRMAAVDAAEPPALTEAEFDQLRAELLLTRRGAPVDIRTESLAQAAELEGIVPGVQNHAIDNYIDLINRQIT